MAAPEQNPQRDTLDFSAVAAEMEREPLSKALWENAQYRVLVHSLQERNEALLARIAELEGQRNGDGRK